MADTRPADHTLTNNKEAADALIEALYDALGEWRWHQTGDATRLRAAWDAFRTHIRPAQLLDRVLSDDEMLGDRLYLLIQRHLHTPRHVVLQQLLDELSALLGHALLDAARDTTNQLDRFIRAKHAYQWFLLDWTEPTLDALAPDPCLEIVRRMRAVLFHGWAEDTLTEEMVGQMRHALAHGLDPHVRLTPQGRTLLERFTHRAHCIARIGDTEPTTRAVREMVAALTEAAEARLLARRIAVGMGLHSRLGAASALQLLGPDGLGLCIP
jgi:hypothetical protein